MNAAFANDHDDSSSLPSSEHEALMSLPVAILIIERSGEIILANPAAQVVTGIDLLSGLAVTNVFPGLDLRELDLASGANTAARFCLDNGTALKVTVRAIARGGWSLVLSEAADEGAGGGRDPVTDLPDHGRLRRDLAERIEVSAPVVLLALGLERFQPIVDTLGRALGDALLRRVAERLSSLAEPSDVISRTGDCQFMILIERSLDHCAVTALAERMMDLVSRAYAIEGQILNLAARMGAVMPADARLSPDEVIQRADLSMGQACVGGLRFFDQGLAERMEERRRLELDLRRALALKQFELFYQPQIDLRSNDIAGFEALIRWRQAEGHFHSPARFIPVAEETGLIEPIGEWVLRTACEAAAGWARPVTIAVNLSPAQFRSRRLLKSVVSALAHSGLSAGRLELEITESALLDNTDEVVTTLSSLKALGVRVSMDDFGTGYSSLSYLRKFPFDKIKIDQSFVRELDHDDEARAIVRTIAALGSSLGMTVTAEGVETEEQLAQIRSHGCDYVQGYLTGRPLPAIQVKDLLGQPADGE